VSDRLGLHFRTWMWSSVALVALVVGVVTLVLSTMTPSPRTIVLSSSQSIDHVVSARLSVASSRPVRIVIPALGIATAVGRLGLQPDHQVEVPTSTHVVDWFDLGPTPGQVGSSVILGHVDSFVGPGTFFNLKLLKAGDSVRVTLADGNVTRFAVSRVVEYPKTSFPDHLVYGSHGVRELQLVTCGGTFDHATGHYESNVVVFTRLVSVSHDRTSPQVK
jgi:Sortase domain